MEKYKIDYKNGVVDFFNTDKGLESVKECRSPRGERGLKLDYYAVTIASHQVAPHVGSVD